MRSLNTYLEERMNFTPTSIEAVIFDWAGTTVDFGSLAPICAFQRLFKANGVDITIAEAREPMGTEKREHITRLTQMPRIASAWLEKYGQAVTEMDIDRLYEEFVPYQIEAIQERAHLIPGAKEVIRGLQAEGVKIGSNTGYNRQMLSALSPMAANYGYRPDSSVCSEDAPLGRPAPAMSLLNAVQLGVGSVAHCVKVDDTTMGVEEGVNAGMWSVGVAISGNETGLDLEDWQGLPEEQQQAYREKATMKLNSAGAHYVIDTVEDLPAVLVQIEERLAKGERP